MNLKSASCSTYPEVSIDASVSCIWLRRLAELRNRIYYFTTEEGRIMYIPRHLRDDQEYSSEMLNDYLDEGNLEERTTNSLSLTRVCRQIRAAYSPIYAAATKIHVRHLDLTDFIDDKCPHMARDKNAEVVGSLVIDCRAEHVDAETREYDPEYALDIDMLPFLNFCMNRHELALSLAVTLFAATSVRNSETACQRIWMSCLR
jgi:hypothetical protein